MDFIEKIKTLDKRINFYFGDSKKTGVNYFDYEDAVQDGVEKSKKVIEFFYSKNYTLEEISLCGGCDELSHTGYLAYNASYTEVESFVNNAYSDYVNSKEKAEVTYAGWLSSYNFTNFSINFAGNGQYAVVLVGAAKNITIRCSSKDFEPISEIVSLIKKEIYQDNCLVEVLDSK